MSKKGLKSCSCKDIIEWVFIRIIWSIIDDIKYYHWLVYMVCMVRLWLFYLVLCLWWSQRAHVIVFLVKTSSGLKSKVLFNAWGRVSLHNHCISLVEFGTYIDLHYILRTAFWNMLFAKVLADFKPVLTQLWSAPHPSKPKSSTCAIFGSSAIIYDVVWW